MPPDAPRPSLPLRALRKLKRALAGPADMPQTPAGNWGFQTSEDGARVWLETPQPPHNLVNALFNESYCTLIDHCARGAGRHMTAEGFKNNVVENERIVYVRDDETGEYFTIAWLPVCREPQSWRCTSEIGSQIFENATGDLRAIWRVFVPAGRDPLEIWNLEIADLAGKPRKVSLFTYVSMKCDGYDLYGGDLFRIAKYVPDVQSIFVCTDAEQHRQIDFPWHNGFMTADRKPESWDASPGPFIGAGGRTVRDPQAVEQGRCGDSHSSMWPPIAALHYKLEVPASGLARTRILVGACADIAMIESLRQKYLAPWHERDEHLEAARAAIAAIAETTHFETPEPTINRMLNTWGKLQGMYGLTWGTARWGFLGYRDQLQHVIGSATYAPALSRERIITACRHQFADGFALRGWRPIDTHRNVDSSFWLIPAVTEYLKETADWLLLETDVPYYDRGAASVFNHLRRAMERLHADRGPHGLCLMHEGDWNDSLTGVCRRGKGESVWMSMAFCRAALQMRDLAQRLRKLDLALRMQDWHVEMARAINQHAWDGDWYLCAFDDDGNPIGSAKNDEGRIYLILQAWAQLGGVVDDERWAKAWEAAKNQLDTGWGFMLSRPTYTKPVANVGRLSYIRPGAGENGSVYTHGNAFLLAALLERGLADEALAVWKGINPANPARPGQSMPNVFYNGFYGPDSEVMAGLADHSWTTGSSAWMFHAVLEQMLGLRRTYDGLIVSPCLPSSWPSARVTRRYRGTAYRVEIENPHHISGAKIDSMMVDGVETDPSRVLPCDGHEHTIRIKLGNEPRGIFAS